ncbi:MAG: Lipoprotein [Microgenomates group bacterium Gr01-1014_5]|nr:MAG: Lipoprotein [Microgenomates group bacterium Gr01-1014_5]
MPPQLTELREFCSLWWEFLSVPTKRWFTRFENAKGVLAEGLYRQRGKFARPFIHSGMLGIGAMGIMLAPIISAELPGGNPWQLPAPSAVLSAATENPATITSVSDKVRDKVMDYEVQDGDTISTIAEKFGVSVETILWQNKLTKTSKLKSGQKIQVLPVTGVLHKVAKGETIYSIAKKLDAEPQAIVDFPFNTFVNDETFALAVGQELVIPDGTMPEERPVTSLARRQTPNAGAVAASGSFAWPVQGTFTQGFSWYHKGIDIANRAAPDILAADSGTIVNASASAGGYGILVIIDHGNGYQTLYAHLSQLYVGVGQTVRRGDALGKMGSTGRSTGTHLHFEILTGGGKINPLEALK